MIEFLCINGSFIRSILISQFVTMFSSSSTKTIKRPQDSGLHKNNLLPLTVRCTLFGTESFVSAGVDIKNYRDQKRRRTITKQLDKIKWTSGIGSSTFVTNVVCLLLIKAPQYSILVQLLVSPFSTALASILFWCLRICHINHSK